MDHYSVGGMEFAVRTTDVRFLDVLRRYLGAFRVEDGPQDILFSADCGVEKQLSGGSRVRGLKRLFFGSLKIFQGRALEEMAARLISGMRDWTNHQSNEFLRIRAGGLVVDGGALVLPTLPSTGLAPLVGLMAKGGTPYVGDEIVNIDPVLHQAHGTGLPLLVDTEFLDHFPELDADVPHRARRREEVPVHARPRWPVLLEDLGGTPGAPAPIRWIIFPDFQPGAATELQTMGKAASVFRLTEAAMNMHVWTERGFSLMQQLLDEAWLGRGVIGDLEEGAAMLAGELPS
jgi:hypothetical protein